MGASINGNIEALCSRLDDFVSTKTVVGDAVTIGDVVLIPLIEVSFGMGAVGSENPDRKKTESGNSLTPRSSRFTTAATEYGSLQRPDSMSVNRPMCCVSCWSRRDLPLSGASLIWTMPLWLSTEMEAL